MASLLITRGHQALLDRARSYQVLIDGAQVGTLRDNEAKEFLIDEGEHQIQVKIDWCSSPELNIRVMGEQARLRCGPNATPFTAILYVLAKPSKYLFLEEDSTI